jgi:hypothetical protein
LPIPNKKAISVPSERRKRRGVRRKEIMDRIQGVIEERIFRKGRKNLIKGKGNGYGIAGMGKEVHRWEKIGIRN